MDQGLREAGGLWKRAKGGGGDMEQGLGEAGGLWNRAKGGGRSTEQGLGRPDGLEQGLGRRAVCGTGLEQDRLISPSVVSSDIPGSKATGVSTLMLAASS